MRLAALSADCVITNCWTRRNSSDSEGGEPVVPNGVAMCKIHHAAYDNDLLGVNADYQVMIRPDLLEESDGPTLRHALQELHKSTLTVPSQRIARPDRDLLAERYDRFQHAHLEMSRATRVYSLTPKMSSPSDCSSSSGSYSSTSKAGSASTSGSTITSPSAGA